MRVIVAARLSKKAGDRDQTGLDSQEREAVRWAEAEGHEVIAVVADYKSGRSGLEARPSLRPWVTEPSRLAQYDAIVALKVDRLTRGDRAETAKLEQWAREHAKELWIAAAGGVHFPSEGVQGIQWDLMLRMAHEEWLAISERYRRMQKTLRDKGSLAAGRPPWGFEIVKRDGIKVLEPTPMCRELAPEIFRMVTEGRTLREVASWMDAHGIKTLNGKPWHEGHIASRILRNPAYKGQGSQPVTAGVVPAAAWSAAGAAVAARNHNRHGARRRKALLSPVCGNPDCDATGLDLGPSPMYQLWLGRGQKYPYYRCTGRGPQRRGCGAPLIPTSELESSVASALLADMRPHVESRFEAGDDLTDQIEQLRAKAAVSGSRIESNAIWDQIEALEVQEPKAAQWVTVETDMPEAQYFAELGPDEQRNYLGRLRISAFRHPEGVLVVSILPDGL